MKSVMRSSMLRGSSTNVGNVTLCRSMPTLRIHSAGASQRSARASSSSPGATHLSCEIRDVMIDPSCSSLQTRSASSSAV